jgi:NAD(P)-dependent dehydrogenase (short-subunit alcohol dehydrogenase family)
LRANKISKVGALGRFRLFALIFCAINFFAVMQPLEEKIFVIIGGTSGLGLSAAAAFTARGAKIVAIGRDDEHLESAQRLLGETAFVFAGEATNSSTASRAIQEAQQRFGGFHGLYHVAGGSGRKMGDGPLHEMTDAGLEATMQLNFYSLVYSNRAAVKAFMAQGTGGSILNLGSVLGFSPAPKYFATHAYASAKAAIIGFSQALAAYYAPYNIRINVIAPALTETPMSQRAMQNENILRYVKTKQPLDGGRIGMPQDLDAAAVYFMSDDSRFVTGQVLAIDGGWMVSEGQYNISA